MELPDRTQAKSWEGRDVSDRTGQALGRCVGVFADTATGVAEWLDVEVEGGGRRFIPALEATDTDGSVRVRFSRDEVLAAPTVGDDDQLSKAEELELYRHYGVPVETSESGSLLPNDSAAGADLGTSDTGTSTTSTSTTSTAVAAGGGAVAGVAATTAAVGSSDNTRSDLDTGTTGDDDTRLDTATEGLGPADAQPAGLVETGEDLPVLDPSAASTTVPEGEVTYVDQPEAFVTDEADDAADVPETADAPAPAAPPVATPEPSLPPPTLRRVSQGTTQTSAPAPTPASSSPSSSGTGPALTPLGVIAGIVAAVGLALRARDARARRRNAPAARADRLRKTLQSGSASALSSAGTTLAGAQTAAELVRRQAADAAAKAAREAARRQAQASSTAARRSRKQKRQAAATLSAVSTTASKTSRRQKRQAAAALAAASRSAQQSTRKASASVSAASAAASKSARDASSSLSKATSGGSRRSRRRKAGAVAAVPTRVARRGRKARRSVARKVWDLVVLSTAGGGYVLGAKAGRERYDELSQVATAVAASPQVQSATAAVKDPERRSDLLVTVQQQAASLFGRRGEHRG